MYSYVLLLSFNTVDLSMLLHVNEVRYYSSSIQFTLKQFFFLNGIYLFMAVLGFRLLCEGFL